MATRNEIKTKALARRTRFRAMKNAGLSNTEIAKKEGISRAMVHFITRPRPDENLCPECCHAYTMMLAEEVDLKKGKK